MQRNCVEQFVVTSSTDTLTRPGRHT